MVLLASILVGCLGNISGKAVSDLNKSVDRVPPKVSIDLFVMSQCPFGADAELEASKAVRQFGTDAGLNLYFLAHESGGTFSSLHGQTEVDEDIRQTCIQYYAPEKLLDYLDCVNPSYQTIGSVWRQCAAEAGLDANEVQSCAAGEGKGLFSENIKKGEELGIASSPTMYLNGTPYTGRRDSASIMKALCKYVPDNPVCATIQKEPEVIMTVVSDNSCAICKLAADNYIQQLSGMFDNVSVVELDANTPDAITFISKYGIKAVPAILFDKNVEKTGVYSSLTKYLENRSDLYLLKIEDIKYLGRQEAANTLDLFVMSHCPFGIVAEGFMKEVKEALPDLKFKLHFLVSPGENGTFTSLHGQTEVDEDLHQACIQKYSPEKLLAYIDCVNKDPTNMATAWEACAQANGIGVAKTKVCASGEEGKQMLQEDAALSDELNVLASPTYLLNNQIVIGGDSAESVKQMICVEDTLSGCEKTLSSSQDQSSSGGSCGS
jgi:hypothetical protein